MIPSNQDPKHTALFFGEHQTKSSPFYARVTSIGVSVISLSLGSSSFNELSPRAAWKLLALGAFILVIDTLTLHLSKTTTLEPSPSELSQNSTSEERFSSPPEEESDEQVQRIFRMKKFKTTLQEAQRYCQPKHYWNMRCCEYFFLYLKHEASLEGTGKEETLSFNTFEAAEAAKKKFEQQGYIDCKSTLPFYTSDECLWLLTLPEIRAMDVFIKNQLIHNQYWPFEFHNDSSDCYGVAFLSEVSFQRKLFRKMDEREKVIDELNQKGYVDQCKLWKATDLTCEERSSFRELMEPQRLKETAEKMVANTFSSLPLQFLLPSLKNPFLTLLLWVKDDDSYIYEIFKYDSITWKEKIQALEGKNFSEFEIS